MYGEDAWNAYAEEKYRKQSRQYCQEHAEKRKEYKRQYNRIHRQERKKQDKQYRQEHKEERNNYNRQYRSTQWGRANNIKIHCIYSDKKKGFPTGKTVDETWIIENIFKSRCIYCGESDWTKLGCDRIDNTKGHTPENCVCACEKCNKERGNKYTVDEFIQYMRAKSLSKQTKV